MKQFELACGFAQGERWYAVVVCDEQEADERVRSGIFEGELVLLSKRTLPSRKVQVDSVSQEITVLDVNQDRPNMPITIPYTVRGCVSYKCNVKWQASNRHICPNRTSQGNIVGCCQSSGVQGMWLFFTKN